MRIISGKYGGINLITPANNRITHPMGDRQRMAIFNIIGNASFKGAAVLDIYSGSGSLGMEALSRGSDSVTFVDNNFLAISAINDNLRKIKGNDNKKITVVKKTAENFIKNQKSKFDIIFADPPYDDIKLSTIEMIFSLLKPGALMVLSHPGRGEAPTGNNGVVVVDNRSYASANITFYRRIS
jgi:16S rRNA (guanine966-N2)-methyltransferase